MKKALIFATASACLLAASSIHAALNLVSDPGFNGSETGVLTATSSPWANPGNFPPFTSQANVFISANALAPTGFNAVLQPATLENAVLLQSLSLVAGVGYTVNFELSTPTQNGGSLEVDLNGNVAGVLTVRGNTVFTEYNLTATAATASGVLDFVWTPGSTGAPLDVDNVGVAVPEPTTMVAGALMLLPFAASTFRLRKKKVSA
jgi:hypothetical protein